jgi:hypothetical protein
MHASAPDLRLVTVALLPDAAGMSCFSPPSLFQKLEQSRMALFGSTFQRRSLDAVLGMDIRSAVDEQASKFGLAFQGRPVERRSLKSVPGIDFGSRVKGQLRLAELPGSCGGEEFLCSFLWCHAVLPDMR